MITQGKWEVKLEHLSKGEIGKERVVPVIMCGTIQICELTQLIHLDAPQSITERQANAHHICRCVNSHERLIELLQEVSSAYIMKGTHLKLKIDGAIRQAKAEKT